MAITKTYDPVADKFHYDAGPDGHLVMLGASEDGNVTLPDGTVVDTKSEVVEVPSQLHGVQLVAHLAGNDPATITQEHVDAHNRGEDVPEIAAAFTPDARERGDI